VPIDHVVVVCSPDERGVAIEATATCTGRTGIEMEAITAVSIAAVTIYDMCKAMDSDMRIGEIRLVEKHKAALERLDA
jgi:cyclic pyranopterin phosphate synthase